MSINSTVASAATGWIDPVSKRDIKREDGGSSANPVSHRKVKIHSQFSPDVKVLRSVVVVKKEGGEGMNSPS